MEEGMSQENISKKNNIFKILTIGIVGIVIVALIILFFIIFSSNTISDEGLSQGESLKLKENEEVEFNIDGEEHKIIIDSLYENSIDIIIQSEPIKATLNVGETKKFDLDDDGFYDLQVKLKSIEDGVPEIYIQKIHESISPNRDSVVDPKSTINSEEIVLDIILPKESYVVDEEVSGDYYLKYQGEPFKGAVISCDSSGCSKSIGMIDDIDFNNPDKTNYLKTALIDTFYYEGTYNYSIYIYDCKDIEEKLNKDDCGSSLSGNFNLIEDIIEKVTPLKSKIKSIVVTGENEEYSLECTNNDDCTQTCTNCDDGAYVCAYSSNPVINQKCVECINDFSCVDGYGCVSNVCVIEECDSDHLDLCLDETNCIDTEGYWYDDKCNEEEQKTYPVTDPNTILDCYSENLSEILCSPEDALGFTNLFENRLGLCEISQGTFALGFEPFLGIFRGYDIQNEQGGNCIVKFWFLENSVIDSSLLNKEMICEYDSSKRTTQDVNDCFNDCCSGELVDALNEI